MLAVASGTVVSPVGPARGGNQVRIRHEGGLETYYMHLSSFAPGVRTGGRVDQGQFIGRVGSTGTATGPHLHFSLRKDGAFVDPVAERRRQPPAEPISAAFRAEFLESRDDLLAQIAPAPSPRPPPRRRMRSGWANR